MCREDIKKRQALVFNAVERCILTSSDKLISFAQLQIDMFALKLRASPAVEGPQAEIQRYLAPDGCKFRPGEAHVSSREPRTFFEFKVELVKF
jgi:hypothetical protein